MTHTIRNNRGNRKKKTHWARSRRTPNRARKPAKGKRKAKARKPGRNRAERPKKGKAKKAKRSSTRPSVLRARRRARRIGRKGTQRMVDSVFANLHQKRRLSLANYTVGAMHAPSAAIHAIGAGYAAVAATSPKHGVKQVDRFLSNKGIQVEELTPQWAAFVLGKRKEAIIALDWTEFDEDDHSTLAAYVVTTHGRATPLAWKTVRKSTLRGKRTAYELEMVERLHEAIPKKVGIELLADRGFGSTKLYDLLELFGWDYTIRFRGSIVVEHKGEAKPVKEWLPPSGRATKLRNVRVTRNRTDVGAVVVVRAKKMKEAWYLATNRTDRPASQTVKLYGRRFTIEETFRDQKDLHFGMGLSATHIGSEERRDRLLMLLAIAHALLTLLGAASERSGLDAYLKVNTVKRRTHSLFRQGSYWYHCLPTMRRDWLARLMNAFVEVLAEHENMTGILGAI